VSRRKPRVGGIELSPQAVAIIATGGQLDEPVDDAQDAGAVIIDLICCDVRVARLGLALEGPSALPFVRPLNGLATHDDRGDVVTKVHVRCRTCPLDLQLTTDALAVRLARLRDAHLTGLLPRVNALPAQRFM
jgi:hypothetical protein